jgi:hypothetical protein
MGDSDEGAGIIKLNVGGDIFYTHYANWRISNYFQNLIDGDMRSPASMNDGSEVFIDRDGDLFKHILQYLRAGFIFVKKENALQWLKSEANYYQLDQLVKDLQAKIENIKANHDEYFFFEF